jgi:threonine/homoserine/homoserine lactone efflux protein
MVVQASNPKNLAFFVALLPQFITPGEGVGLQLVVLGIVSVAVELPILVAYSVLAAASTRWLRARAILWIEGLAGGILVGLGAALASARR